MPPISAGVKIVGNTTVIASGDVALDVFASMLAVMKAAAPKSAATHQRRL